MSWETSEWNTQQHDALVCSLKKKHPIAMLDYPRVRNEHAGLMLLRLGSHVRSALEVNTAKNRDASNTKVREKCSLICPQDEVEIFTPTSHKFTPTSFGREVQPKRKQRGPFNHGALTWAFPHSQLLLNNKNAIDETKK